MAFVYSIEVFFIDHLGSGVVGVGGDLTNIAYFNFHFSTELWPLIDVRILFPFNIMRTRWPLIDV